jgi:hypothetical protein
LLGRYVELLRLAYLTRCEFANPHFAGKTIFGCVLFHLLTPVVLIAAVTGAKPTLSKGEAVACILVAVGAVDIWESFYVERSPALSAIAERLAMESETERRRRMRFVSLFVWGTFVAFFVALAAWNLRLYFSYAQRGVGV